jgi:hypothetical protein
MESMTNRPEEKRRLSHQVSKRWHGHGRVAAVGIGRARHNFVMLDSPVAVQKIFFVDVVVKWELHVKAERNTASQSDGDSDGIEGEEPAVPAVRTDPRSQWRAPPPSPRPPNPSQPRKTSRKTTNAKEIHSLTI